MNRLGLLLGSSTRGNLVAALSTTYKPLTAYRIAKSYNMNVAKVYLEARRLAELGLLEARKSNRGTGYVLSDKNLRLLALRLSERVTPYDEWSSNRAKRARFRAGLSIVPQLSGARPTEVRTEKPSRFPGELENLAMLAKLRFNGKYRKKSARDYDRL